jgi:hypothetical protein
MALGSETHSFDQNQRYVPLTFGPASAAGTVIVNAPANARIAPPGEYLLFFISDQGVPSEGRLVKLVGPTFW